MFHIQWGAASQPLGRGQRISNPFQEMEMEMNSFRNAAVSSFFGRDDPYVTSFEDELENLIDNSRNLMSMLPVIPSDQNVSRRRAPRRPVNRNANQRVFELGTNTNQAQVSQHEVNANTNPRNRRNTLRNFLDRNNHVFPAPQQERQVWYDPSEPIPENRLPHISPRVLTLAQINRIPTKKVTKAGGSCDICLDDFKKGESTKVLNCKHDYHVKCVDPWLKQHTTCPKCRRQVRAPPENQNRPPRPVPPPCPVRERARAYDRDRRARERADGATLQQNLETVRDEAQARAEEIQTVADLPPVENPIPRASERLTTEFPVASNMQSQPEQISDTSIPDGNDQIPSQQEDIPPS